MPLALKASNCREPPTKRRSPKRLLRAPHEQNLPKDFAAVARYYLFCSLGQKLLPLFATGKELPASGTG